MASDKQTMHSELRDIIRSELLTVKTEMMRQMETISADVKHLSYRLSMVEKSVELLNSSQVDRAPTAAATGAMERVQQSISATVAFNNPLNIVFYGLKHQSGVTLDSIVRRFMCEEMHAEPDRAFNMPIHVQYLPKMSPTEYHVPVCVTFRSIKDKDYIKHKAEKYEHKLVPIGVCVRGSGYTAHGLALWKVGDQ